MMFVKILNFIFGSSLLSMIFVSAKAVEAPDYFEAVKWVSEIFVLAMIAIVSYFLKKLVDKIETNSMEIGAIKLAVTKQGTENKAEDKLHSQSNRHIESQLKELNDKINSITDIVEQIRKKVNL